VIIAPVALFTFWYWEGENFSPGAVSGTYIVKFDHGSSTLTLKPDLSFRQQLDRGGTIRRAGGTWRVIGEGHIAFSREFLPLPGEEISPVGTAYGDFVNRFGIAWINLRPNPGGLTFRRKWFH